MGCLGNGRDSTPGCWATFREEWSPLGDYYFVRDPVTDRILDVQETFAPLSTLAVIAKVLTAAATMGTFAYVLYQRENRGFSFAYLTFWVVALQCIYHLLSLSNSFFASSIEQPEYWVGGRCRLTWYFFNLSMPASIIVAM